MPCCAREWSASLSADVHVSRVSAHSIDMVCKYGCQVVSQSGQVVFEDVWLFGYRDAEASQDLTRVWVSPAANTSTSPQVMTLQVQRPMSQVVGRSLQCVSVRVTRRVSI